MKSEMVFVEEGKVLTDTLIMAKMFGKPHDDVMKKTRKQMDYAGEWGVGNFSETTYINKQNKQVYPKIDMTDEAFTLVAMSYNTKEAVQMKIKFIEEFKRMKEYIQNIDKRSSKDDLILKIVHSNDELEKALLITDFEKLIKEEGVEEAIKKISELPKQTVRDIVNKVMKNVGFNKFGGNYGEGWKPVYDLFKLNTKRKERVQTTAKKQKKSNLDVMIDEDQELLLKIVCNLYEETATRLKNTIYVNSEENAKIIEGALNDDTININKD